MPIQVWGDAEPGEAIEVRIGETTTATQADDLGRWWATCPAHTPSAEPVDFVVTASDQIKLVNVVVGEVWLCAGQSNMEFPLEKCSDAEGALAEASNRLLRLLHLSGAASGGSGEYGPQLVERLTPAKFCRGVWSPCSAQSARDFSAVGYYFGKALQDSLDVPVGLISAASGGTPAEAWVRRGALAASPELAGMVRGDWLENPQLDEWCRDRACSNLASALASPDGAPGDELGPHHSFKPGFMWDAGVAPLVPLACRGVIWYQGESNAESPRRVAQHQQVFETLVTDWRAQWRRPDLPFLFVQLPAMGRPNWPAFRQSQFDCLRRLEHTGMIVSIDTGHPTNVHPIDKRPIGLRLAYMAEGLIYQRPTERDWSGPLVRSARREGEQVLLDFDHTGGGLQSVDGEPLRHFELAGADGRFFAAQAEIDGPRIRVSSSKTPAPTRVRYAWLPYPRPAVNLFNGDGLPASPFEVEID